MHDALTAQIIRDAAAFYAHGWLMGTSGNLSARLDDRTFLITASGRNKGELSGDDFLVVDLACEVVRAPEGARPSAETALHAAVYRRFSEVGAVYHVHEPFSALCSHRDEAKGATVFERVEMIKGWGIWEEDASVSCPILENPAHIPALASLVEAYLEGASAEALRVPCVNIVRHGPYVWGAGPFEARRHLESLAYLCHDSWQKSLLYGVEG